MSKTCVNCLKTFEKMPYAATCSEPCHQAYIEATIEATVASVGETKKITHMGTGKTHLVPVRDIIERGVSGSDLHKYPIVDEP